MSARAVNKHERPRPLSEALLTSNILSNRMKKHRHLATFSVAEEAQFRKARYKDITVTVVLN